MQKPFQLVIPIYKVDSAWRGLDIRGLDFKVPCPVVDWICSEGTAESLAGGTYGPDILRRVPLLGRLAFDRST